MTGGFSRRIRIIETKREPVEARDKFIDDVWRNRPAIIHREVAWRAIGVDEVWNARKLLQSAIRVVAERVLRAVCPTHIDRVALVEVVIDLRGEVILAFSLRRDKTEAGHVQSITDVEVIWQRRESDDELRRRVGSKVQRVRKDVVSSECSDPARGLPLASTDGLVWVALRFTPPCT